MRHKLTLSVEAELIDQMKIRCILEKRELSTITEELYREYLRRSEKPKAKRINKAKSRVSRPCIRRQP